MTLLVSNGMKVILLQDVRGVGRKNELKEVSDGYARNFLINKGLAAPADSQHLAAKKQADAKLDSDRQAYLKEAAKLAGEIFEFTIKAGLHGETFGSVSKKDIEAALRAKGYSGQPILEHPIKGTGEQMVEVSFSMGVKGKMKINIKPAV